MTFRSICNAERGRSSGVSFPADIHQDAQRRCTFRRRYTQPQTNGLISCDRFRNSLVESGIPIKVRLHLDLR